MPRYKYITLEIVNVQFAVAMQMKRQSSLSPIMALFEQVQDFDNWVSTYLETKTQVCLLHCYVDVNETRWKKLCKLIPLHQGVTVIVGGIS